MLPDMYQESIFKIDYKKLYKNNIKFLLFDLDNTILPQNKYECNKELIELFNKIKKIGIKPIIYSNSLESRVKKIAKQLDIEHVSLALKPAKFKFINTLKKYGFKNSETAIIGDQFYTDIKGGKKVGIKTILVDQVSDYDNIFTIINRKRENKLKEKLNFKNGSYYE